MTRTVEGRTCALSTTLGANVLMLTSMRGGEGISQLFNFQMQLVSQEGGIEFEQIVGQPVCVELALDRGSSRYFHGIVSRFWQGGAYQPGGDDQGYVCYRADVVPWLWTLTRATNCRVFENETVPDIIRAVFDDLGYRENEDYEFASLGEAHEEIEYCVQYRETNFNFVSRLMEEQGLAYAFRHEADKHTMVIFDTSATCPDCPDYGTITYGGTAGSAGDEQQVDEWSVEQVMPPGKYALNGYDLENPSDDLNAPTQSALSMGGNSKYEIYDYPPYYTHATDGRRYVKFRMEAEEADSHLVQGSGCCGAFTAGVHVTLTGHYRESFNDKRYLLTQVRHSLSQPAPDGGGGSSYENSFTCLPESIPYRPLQETPKPSVQGSQTAVVVGPSGEEVHCDPYGRVRIQFHWDRGGKDDGTDVCWARVAQSSAGKRWGALFTPRMGQEVVVTFLDGDPDRPLITGVVYNAEQMPPYELDANKTQSGIKTRSSKGATPENFNEIRFEDKKGEEELFIQAEKHMNISVKKNYSASVGIDGSVSSGENFTESVGTNKTVTVGADHSEEVTGSQTLTVSGSRSRSVTGADTVEASSDRSVTVAGSVSENTTGSHSITSSGPFEVTAPDVTVTGSASAEIDGAIIKIVGGAQVEINAPTIKLTGGIIELTGLVKHN